MTESIETSEADALPWRPSRTAMPAINTQFRSKPVEVEAFQLPAAGQDVPDAFHEWCERVGFSHFESGRDETLLITTPEGVMEAQPGDWIICGVLGEFYPCKPGVFAATYVPAAVVADESDGEPGDVETVIACLGDDAAALRSENSGSEVAENMERAADLIAALANPMAVQAAEALTFYAQGHHFIQHDPTAWDTVSGEPQNFFEDEANTATVEDGSIARIALAALAKAAPADARDAKRYRWLRAGMRRRQGLPTNGERVIGSDKLRNLMEFRFWCTPEELDAAIDAALQPTQGINTSQKGGAEHG
ncbi:hypothetical protein [Variovorax sp.]|jgi:hypothetical protein|uniref:hypothetical protein n=1 Tax=Variovorax sp. TaxID=1871043 RepID=UPI0037DA1B64